MVSEKASAFVNVAPATLVAVTRVSYELTTVNTAAIVTFGYTTAPNGAGVLTPVLMQRRIYTPADLADAGNLAVELYFDPPIFIRYSDGARTVCFIALGELASTMLDIEWLGWWAPDNPPTET